jgi:mono/diheme cytochrome c family protein
MTKGKIIASVVAALVAAGAVVGFAVTWRPAIAAIEPPSPKSFDPVLVKRGRDLAAIGNCNDCHTVRGGKDFAGGLPVPTPFGTIYSSNITPDVETGIGRWPETAFRRAMRSGVDRSGQHLYPTFPYDHFTNVSDEDDSALYAYLMTRTPVRAPARANQLAFPLDQRFVIAGWKLLFLRRGTYQPDPAQSAEWNRGAYLVEGLAHCGSCHTPRNALGAERLSARFAGGDVDNWHAYAINAQSPAPVPWNADALFAYLRDGWQPDHGVARGPMAQVVSNLSGVSDSDIRAIATYMAGVFGPPTPDHQRRGDEALAQTRSPAIQSAAANASGESKVVDQIAPRAGIGRQCRGCCDLRCGMCDLPRNRQIAALWRGQSRALERHQWPRCAQRRQHRAVGGSPGRGRAQPDHAGFCLQHERRPDFSAAEIFAGAVWQPAGMDRR